ncbi:hypothetical protein [Hydrogenophaga intermedia]|uniref:Uncharacterized protein n=1 Tax=Hydrogenophaga intermedia TaxID=65786 RepID=A0A1L1PXA0_HYDIT|nr:hypothetical protein [Hydrogenophaga intermedia]TMU69824.1 hypothetical protein FGJ01_24660 [Hydrogenophaga intermedia]CDN90626.1 hypothetical protein BN948_05071 [Hydrogenophaga intermedia]
MMRNLVSRLFKGDSQLSSIEKAILDCVRGKLDGKLLTLWDSQVQAINKVQRLPDGVETDFYRMLKGRPSFPEELAFPNKTEELLLAKVRVDVPGVKGALSANVWCVRGYLFSIEFAGNVGYFEEAARSEPRPHVQVSCELTADLVSA